MTPDPNQHHEKIARQGRLLALVIAATMILWMAAPWIGGAMGLNSRYVFLFDMLALSAFVWALFVGVQLWRKQRGG